MPRSKVKSRSHHYFAHLHPHAMSIPNINYKISILHVLGLGDNANMGVIATDCVLMLPMNE